MIGYAALVALAVFWLSVVGYLWYTALREHDAKLRK